MCQNPSKRFASKKDISKDIINFDFGNHFQFLLFLVILNRAKLANLIGMKLGEGNSSYYFVQ